MLTLSSVRYLVEILWHSGLVIEQRIEVVMKTFYCKQKYFLYQDTTKTSLSLEKKNIYDIITALSLKKEISKGTFDIKWMSLGHE